jgi:hypothetical protein
MLAPGFLDIKESIFLGKFSCSCGEYASTVSIERVACSLK